MDRTTDPIRQPGRLERERLEDDDSEPVPDKPVASPAQTLAPTSRPLPPLGTAGPPDPPDGDAPRPAPTHPSIEAPDPPAAGPRPAAPAAETSRPAPAPPADRSAVVADRTDGDAPGPHPHPPPATPAARVPGREGTAPGPDGGVQDAQPVPESTQGLAGPATAAAVARAEAHDSAQAAQADAEAAAADAEAATRSAEAAVGSAETAAAGAEAARGSAQAAAGSVEAAMRSAEAAAGSAQAAMRSAQAAEAGAQAAVRSAQASAGSVETAVGLAEAAAGSEAAVRPTQAATGLVTPAAAEVTEAVRPRPGRLLGVGALLVAEAVAGGLAGGLVGATVTRGREGTTSAARQGAAAPAGPDGTPSSGQLRQIAAAVLPAVVRVQARTSDGRATGSGVIFTADGYVLTNAHVVDGARTIAVTLATAEPLKASLVGADPLNDLAVLRVRRSALPVASFGRSADLAVGDAAIVVGSPFGFPGSVTSGIVSALHRVVKVPGDQGPGTGHELVDVIQTDAAINPGNSGGALADGGGRVVGISTAIATSGNVESSAGVGFAIPIEEALEVARTLVAKKPVRVPFLGWEIEDLSAETAARYRLQGRSGALLGAVRPGGPAAKAELRKGDLVVRFGEVPVRDGDQLAVALRRATVGEPVPILIVRRGRELNLLAVPTAQPRR